MDEQLQAKIEEAKAAGYSDEEIQTYLQTKDKPLPPEQPINRTEEYKGIATAVAPDTLTTAAEIGAAGYAGKKLLNAWRGAPASAAAPAAGSPSTIMQQFATPNGYRVPGTGTSPISYNQPTTIPKPTPLPGTPEFNNIARPATPVAPQAPMTPQAARQASLAEKGMETAAKMRQMAADFAAQNAGRMLKGGVGAAALLYSPGLNKNEDEELARRRQQGFNPNGALGATSGY